MNKQKIMQLLSQTNGLTITTADELIEALYYGDVNIFENLPYYSNPDDSEEKELDKLVLDALTEKHTIKGALKILDRQGEIRSYQEELTYKHCFREGIKIGLAMAEFFKETSE